MINIEGLNKADVLAALYNASSPQGMGFMQYDSKPMNSIEAQLLLDQHVRFDYLKGRVMKLNLSSDVEFDERLYDRDNGDGAAANAIKLLRGAQDVNPPASQHAHKVKKAEAAMDVLERIHEENRITTEVIIPGELAIPALHLGLSDVAEQLVPAVEAAVAPDTSDTFGGGESGGAGGGDSFGGDSGSDNN